MKSLITIFAILAMALVSFSFTSPVLAAEPAQVEPGQEQGPVLCIAWGWPLASRPPKIGKEVGLSQFTLDGKKIHGTPVDYPADGCSDLAYHSSALLVSFCGGRGERRLYRLDSAGHSKMISLKEYGIERPARIAPFSAQSASHQGLLVADRSGTIIHFTGDGSSKVLAKDTTPFRAHISSTCGDRIIIGASSEAPFAEYELKEDKLRKVRNLESPTGLLEGSGDVGADPDRDQFVISQHGSSTVHLYVRGQHAAMMELPINLELFASSNRPVFMSPTEVAFICRWRDSNRHAYFVWDTSRDPEDKKTFRVLFYWPHNSYPPHGTVLLQQPWPWKAVDHEKIVSRD